MDTAALLEMLLSRPQAFRSENDRRIVTQVALDIVRDADAALRRRVAETLATRADAPLELVLRLVHDDAAIARPLLQESPVLRDADLIEVAQHRTLRHRLAIALRRDISEDVCRVLVSAGEDDVARVLLENQSARIPYDSMQNLVARASRDERLHEPLVARWDLDPGLAARLFGFVSEGLRREILRSFAIEPALVDAAIRKSLAALQREERNAPPSAVRRMAESLACRGDEVGTLLALLRGGEVCLFEALFMRLTGLSPCVARRVLYEAGGRALAVACASIGMEKWHFATIFLLVRQARPDDKQVDPAELRAAIDFFESTGRDAAETVMAELRNPQANRRAGGPGPRGEVPGGLARRRGA